MKVHPIVAELIGLGVTVEISQDEKGVMYDLQTGAKSHMYARETVGGTLALFMRYNEEREIETFEELCTAFDACLNTDGYHNSSWGEAMRKCGHWPSAK